jgi:hypothetical protein
MSWRDSAPSPSKSHHFSSASAAIHGDGELRHAVLYNATGPVEAQWARS